MSHMKSVFSLSLSKTDQILSALFIASHAAEFSIRRAKHAAERTRRYDQGLSKNSHHFGVNLNVRGARSIPIYFHTSIIRLVTTFGRSKREL